MGVGRFLAVLGVLLLARPGLGLAEEGQPVSAGGLEAELELIRSHNGVPALGAAIVHADGRVEVAATGLRRRGQPDRVTADDLWHIGSNTKAMTAVLAARLVEQGRIGWDTTLAEVFPDLAAAMQPAWAPVTLEMLLGMRAGVPEDISRLSVWADFWRNDRPLPDLRLALVREVTGASPVTPPGSAWAYSNASYVMAGAMLERRTDRSWEDLMRTELFQPLGLDSAGFGAPTGGDQPWGHQAGLLSRLTGVTPMDPAGGKADNPPALGPAGTVHLSLRDYGRFLKRVLDGADGKDDFLGADSWRRLLTPGLSDYALGWGVRRPDWAGGRPAYGHAGSNTLWMLTARVVPGRGYAMALATNVGGSAGEAATAEGMDRLRLLRQP
ncbi:serine hydrolase domain-containing protein [Oleisolibacter albus]|uniref:serine hydrolase domain-containing protein n=1 Tax=Oleisolibacter albus TaxID=2171757 RepID=UPI000DF4C57E|nr:serine hydrolase domain-containing protein [Oleisolibacter albus]